MLNDEELREYFGEEEDDDNFADLDGSENDAYLLRRDEFIEKFRYALAGGQTRYNFSEDRWIRLIDYADDIGDGYLYDMAATLGMAEYPYSRDLYDRRLYGMAGVYSDSFMETVIEGAAKEENASRYVRMRAAYYSWRNLDKRKATALKAYKMIFETLVKDSQDSSKIQDFDIIEAVSIISEVKALKYMAKDMEKWEKRTYNREMLWYEFVNAAHEADANDLAMPVIEKLITDYPYNRLYWMLKARVLTSETLEKGNATLEEAMDRIDEIIGIFDTALAIDPDDETAKSLKAKIVETRENLAYEAVAQSVVNGGNHAPELDRRPEDTMQFMDLVKLFDLDSDEALAVIDAWAIRQIRLLDSDDDLGDTDVNEHPDFYNLVESLYMSGRPEAVDHLLELLERESDKKHLPLAPVAMLRHLDNFRFDEAIIVLSEIPAEHPTLKWNPTKLILTFILHDVMETNLSHNAGNEMEEMQNTKTFFNIFFHELIKHHSRVNPESDRFMSHVNPTLLFYLSRYFVSES